MAALLDVQTLTELKILYSSKDRKYHNLGHVNSLLELLRQHRGVLADPDAIEAAIWFHDAIYDAKATDNETKSAELALSRLSSTDPPLDRERVDRICTMIEATATHTVPQFTDARFVSDAEMFLDMDLSILGAEEEEFEKYEAAVREEYAWVSQEGWRKGRSDVLKSFLQRPFIFYSGVFREGYEKAARENIARSLKKLDAAAEAASDTAIL